MCVYHRKREEGGADTTDNFDKRPTDSKSGAANSSIDVDGSNIEDEEAMDADETEVRGRDEAAVKGENASLNNSVDNHIDDPEPVVEERATLLLDDLNITDPLLDHPVGWTFT